MQSGWSVVCGHSTQCAVLLLSANGVLLPCALWRFRKYRSWSVAVNRFVCLLSLAPSVTITHNYHVITLLLRCVSNAMLLSKLRADKQIRNSQIFFKLFWLMQFSNKIYEFSVSFRVSFIVHYLKKR